MPFSERYNAPSSIIYFDVNGMKTTNDTYAHSAGDASLMRVADVLLEIVRVSAIIGRLGEDEFAVILPQGDRETALEKPTAWPRSSNPSRWTGMAYPFRYI